MPSDAPGMLPAEMGASPSLGLLSYLRGLLFALCGISDAVDSAPRVLIER